MHTTKNTLILCLSLVIITVLSGCRITGGSSGNSKPIQHEAPKTVWANAYAPIVLNEQNPKARYRVDVHVNFGNYKKKKAGWDQFFYLGHTNKTKNSILRTSLYKADGKTLIFKSEQNNLGNRKTTSQSGVALTPKSQRKTGQINRIHITDSKLYPDKLPPRTVSINCPIDAKTCQTSFIYEIEFNAEISKMANAEMNITPAHGAYFGSQANIQAHEECFTFLACVDGKDVKKIRPTVKITKIN